MTGVFLQVRLSSKRLPEKALIKIKDLTIIEHSMRALKQIDVDHFILLTTEDCIARLESLAIRWGFTLFSGPEKDVLKRFILASKKFKIDTIIRATGDNPLVSGEMASKVLKEHIHLGADYSNWTDAPYGSGIEVVESKALIKADLNTNESYDREHVTPWVYNNPDSFMLNIKRTANKYLYNIKVSVDTEDDLIRVQTIFDNIYNNQPIELEDLINFCKQENKTEK
ncbi:MAG: hypothetical protein GY760_12215 [Deltaproteobacteria bacterium]|nr:hypothetical protein [Deltaproteobacteria bacterium]